MNIETEFWGQGLLWLGGIVVTGLTGLTGSKLFWTFVQQAAEKKIDHHFSTRLAQFQHEQAKELQHIKARIDTVIQGSLRFQEREFKLIPELWEKIEGTLSCAQILCTQRDSFPDVGNMPETALESFLSHQTDVDESSKDRVRRASRDEKNELWRKIDRYQRLRKAGAALEVADQFSRTHTIFLPDEFHDFAEGLLNSVRSAIHTYAVGLQFDDHKLMVKAWDELEKSALPLLQSLKSAIKQRFVEQTRLSDSL